MDVTSTPPPLAPRPSPLTSGDGAVVNAGWVSSASRAAPRVGATSRGVEAAGGADRFAAARGVRASGPSEAALPGGASGGGAVSMVSEGFLGALGFLSGIGR